MLGKIITKRYRRVKEVTSRVSLSFTWKSFCFFGTQVREREEEISALLLRVRDAEGRSRRATEDKEDQLR